MDLNAFAALLDSEVISLVAKIDTVDEIRTDTTLGDLRRVSQLNPVRGQAPPQDHDPRRTRKS